MAKVSKRRTRQTKKRISVARSAINDLRDLCDTLERGEPIESRFTVRTVSLDLEPDEFGPAQIRKLRASLGASQAVFAKIVGASAACIEAWEQGVRVPTPMARRLLGEIKRNRPHWSKFLQRAIHATAATG